MTLDTRARRAAQGIYGAVDAMERSTKEPLSVERFDRFRDRKQRNRRVGAILVAALLAILTIVVVTNAFERRDRTIPVMPPSSQSGRIVFGKQGSGYPRDTSNNLFTMNPDGTDLRDLSVKSMCMSWAPDGSKILVGATDPATNKTVAPATINPDGTGYTELGATTGHYSIWCGAFSPDGTRIALGGSVELEHYGAREPHGIFTIRASDGADLVRLTPRNGTNPSYSPNGAQVVFEGVQGPRGACLPHAPPSGGSYTCPPGTYRIGELDGSVFVVDTDGTGLHRIVSHVPLLRAPLSWSPDGRWILFSDGNAVYVVHPDGTGLRRITFLSVPKLRVDYPSWSPDGTRFVFVGNSAHGSNLFTARRDGTDVEQITHTHGIFYRGTAWGRSAS